MDLLALPTLRLVGPVIETNADIELEVRLDWTPCCADHPGAKAHRNGADTPLANVRDTPMRGKPVILTVRRDQFTCSVCGSRLIARGPDLAEGKLAMTRRLVRYVEDAVLRRSATVVAQETGLSDRQVAAIANRLIERLAKQGFRFPTPDIVVMDGIECSRTRKFQIVTDGRTGRPLGMFEGLDADTACRELPRIIDVERVKVFVSDMHGTNVAVSGAMPGALHVADKFHVIETCNSAVWLVVSDQVARLKARGRHDDERKLRELQPTIAGRRTAAQAKNPQFEFDLETPPNQISRYKPINLAHRARWMLLHAYRAEDRATAAERLDRFLARASEATIATRMAPAISYVRNHRAPILAYFDALERQHDGVLRGPTTNAAERRNGVMKDLWHASRGFGEIAQFRLKALFHPYRLDRHLIECAACGRFEGPFSEQEALTRATAPRTLPHEVRCTACAGAH